MTFDPPSDQPDKPQDWEPPTALAALPGWYLVAPGVMQWWDGTMWQPSWVKEHKDQYVVAEAAGAKSALACWVGGALALVLGAAGSVLGRPTLLFELIGALLGTWAGLFAGVWLACRRTGTSMRSFVGAPSRWRATLLIGLVAGVVLRVVAGVVTLPFLPWLSSQSGVFAATPDVSELHGAAVLTVLAVAAVVGAPLLEEAFFRGVLQTTLASRYTVKAGIAIQALVFATAHLSLSASGARNGAIFSAILVTGAGLGWLRNRTKSLVPGMLAHALFNAVAVAALLALPWLEHLQKTAGR